MALRLGVLGDSGFKEDTRRYVISASDNEPWVERFSTKRQSQSTYFLFVIKSRKHRKVLKQEMKRQLA